MDLRNAFSFVSSWQASSKLNCLLRVISSSGVILDEPFASERAEVTLVQPSSSEDDAEPSPCYITIDSAHLRGYFLAAVELVSQSRTVELYSGPGQEYVCTERTSLVEELEDGTKVHSVQFELPPDLHSTSLSLKLLSLKGRTEVRIKELNVIVTEDHGGTRMTSSDEQSLESPSISGSSSSQVDLQQMLQSISGSQNVPPFLKSLASSLQLLQSHKPPSTGGRNTSTASGGASSSSSVTSMPAELSQMMDAFKQLQPPRPSPPSASTAEQSSREGKEERTKSETKEADDNNKVAVNDGMTKLLDERLAEMEARLREYVDSKLASLENQLLSKLSTLSQRIDMLSHTPQMDNSSEQCTVSNGGLSPPLPFSEDPQLD